MMLKKQAHDDVVYYHYVHVPTCVGLVIRVSDSLPRQRWLDSERVCSKKGLPKSIRYALINIAKIVCMWKYTSFKIPSLCHNRISSPQIGP